MRDAEELWLFSYGTLRDPKVQQGVFGRLLHEQPDTLAGWRIESVAIGDPGVASLSGLEVHRILRPSSDPRDIVEGAALSITRADLPAVDAYETDAYRRVEAMLASGRAAFVYVGD